MNAAAESSQRPAEKRVCSVLICDLADSTALVEALGDSTAAELFREHDRHFRACLQRYRGIEIDKTDGFLALFDSVADAADFALDYRSGLAGIGTGIDTSQIENALRARVGIHVGELVLWRNSAADISRGAKPLEVEGLAKPIAARMMSLALPGQILLSASACNQLAEQPQQQPTTVHCHGRYRFKGARDLVLVHELLDTSASVPRRPPGNDKAWRHAPLWRRLDLHLKTYALVAMLALAVSIVRWQALASIDFSARDWVVLMPVQNLTGETLLDQSLDAALRIGLEQSRHVNVFPDVQLRQTLARMERDPGSEIDRDTAIEIAVRERAAAVLVPTIAEIGGRLRVSIEVVQPASGRSAFIETADGRGLNSVLPTTGKVLGRIRQRLGESAAALAQDTLPLEQVTTSNLEALKAFSLGIRAGGSRDPQQAMSLYRRALELDPEFSAVHAKLGAYALVYSDGSTAREHFLRASDNQQRLSARERLYVLGHLASFDSPAAALERWLQLASLYPDMYTGQQNYALAQWIHLNNFEAAEPYFREVVASSHPLRGLSMQTLGTVLLGQGRIAEAREAYRDAASLGSTRLYLGDVDVELVARDYAAAEALLALPADPGEISYSRQSRTLRQLAYLLERGRIEEALTRLEDPQLEAEARNMRIWNPSIARALILGEVDADAARELSAELIVETSATLGTLDLSLDKSALYDLLKLALISARLGDWPAAQQALSDVALEVNSADYPDLAQLRAAIEAEILLAQGQPEAARAALPGELDRNQRYQLAYTRLRVALANKDTAGARQAGAWLVEHRGRAYAETLGRWRLSLANVLSANMALLETLEIAAETPVSGEDAQTLLAAWSDADTGWEPLRRAQNLRRAE